MCGRYGFVPGTNFEERFEVEYTQAPLPPSYNVAPGATMPVVVQHGSKRVELMKWGLIPFWAKGSNIGYNTINARAETVASSPTFRESFKRRRCLVPANGFYEWQKTERGKLPYFIHLKDSELFAFAGLYDIWKDAEGNELRTYTIITTIPNDLVAPIHNRMPVILHPDDEAMWVDPRMNDTKALRALLNPFPDALMEAYPVSRAVNTPAANVPALMERVAA
jgi:putative SOS response-associated peptidase YedK